MASTRIDPDFDRYFQTMDWMDGDFIHEQSPPQHGAEPGRAYHSPTSTNHSHGPYIPEASECASQNAWHFPRGQNVSLQSYHGVNGGPSQHEPVPHNFDQRSSRAQATTGLLHQSSSGLPASHVAPANGEADREVSFSLSGQRTRRRRSIPGPFGCGWIGCPDRDGFSTKSSLWRHIQGFHLLPLGKCPWCEKMFRDGRGDKFHEHVVRVHPERVQAR